MASSRDGRPLVYGRETEPPGDAEAGARRKEGTRRKRTAASSRAAPAGSDTAPRGRATAPPAPLVEPGSKKSSRAPSGWTKDSLEERLDSGGIEGGARLPPPTAAAAADPRLEERLEFLEARVEELRSFLQGGDLKGSGIAGQGAAPSLELRAYIDSKIDEKLAGASTLPLADAGKTLAQPHQLPTGQVLAVQHEPRASRMSLQTRTLYARPAHLDRGDAYELEASVWDMCMFVGHPCLGWKVSLMALIPYCINIGMQVLFCIIVSTALVGQNLVNSDLEGLLHFRLGVAHNVQYADSVTYQSLASQICNKDFKLHYAGSQLDLRRSILEFQKTYSGMYLGHWLAVMTQFLWVCTASNEVAKTLKYARVLLGLPKTAVTRIVAEVRGEVQNGGEVAFTHEDDVVVHLKSISRKRSIWVLVGIVAPRLIIAWFVCVVGALYLGETFVIGDLILNAIALAFILECDELLFAMFAPFRIASLQKHLEPIPIKPAAWKQWPWVETLLKGLLTSGIMLLIYVFVLAPFHWRLAQASDIMCSGDADFVYAVNSASGMVHVAKSKTYETGNWTYVEKVVLQAAQSSRKTSPLNLASNHGWTVPSELQTIFDSEDEEASIESGEYTVTTLSDATFHSSDFERVSYMQAWSTEVTAQFLPCSDLGGAGNRDAALNKLRLLVGNRSISACEDVSWQLCSQWDMSELRALCPVMCNCNLPSDRGAITGFFGHPKFGCPAQCASQVAAHSERDFLYLCYYYYYYVDVDNPCVDMVEDEFIFTGEECLDSDWDSDSGDTKRDGCWAEKYWTGDQSSPEHPCSGSLDDDDFTAGTMCCACGGGTGNNTNLSSYTCSQNLEDGCREIGGPARFWVLYVNGLFEYLSSRKGFEDMVLDSLEDGILPIEAKDHEMLVTYIVSGQMKRSVLEHGWEFAPGLDHPRDLVGCQYLTSWEFKLLLNVDLCSPSSFASIQRLCPMSCGCGSGSSIGECPVQCVVQDLNCSAGVSYGEYSYDAYYDDT